MPYIIDIMTGRSHRDTYWTIILSASPSAAKWEVPPLCASFSVTTDRERACHYARSLARGMGYTAGSFEVREGNKDGTTKLIASGDFDFDPSPEDPRQLSIDSVSPGGAE